MKKALITAAKLVGWFLLGVVVLIALVNPDAKDPDRWLWLLALWLGYVHFKMHRLQREVERMKAK